MKVDRKKIIAHLEELYACGAQEDGTFTRMAYSDEDLRGREIFKRYLKVLGISTRMDEAGNLIGRWEGQNPNLPAILIGSHLDTVPDGGKYDGVLGCVAGVGICETLMESGYQLQHPLEVIVFTDEEGFRFGSGLLGSGAICGEPLTISEEDLDMYGQSRKEVFQNYGITVEQVTKAKRNPKSVHCFLELHIEQGGSLYKNQIPVGIVSSIAGVSRYEIKVKGQANHAGSTMMEDRKDALVAAAQFISEVPRRVEKIGNAFTVATVGVIKVVPNSVNVIPGNCSFYLEIRDQDAKVMEEVETSLKEYMEEICNAMEMELSWEPISYHAPAPMSEKVKAAIQIAAEKECVDHRVIPSGAFHDSLLMSRVFPTGMIFVPSEKGISHSREEYTLEENIECGVNVLLQAILEVDNMEITC
ncbi:MAG: Zn-dependent hydrolase [Lachnospiraceae bacterium]